MVRNHARRFLAAVLAVMTLCSMFTFTANAASNLAVIYYKGYTSPYIHYQTSNGLWTTAPGLKMEKNNEAEGYTHKYTIDLGSKTSTKLCFNNGNGTWDNNGGKDHTAVAGNNYYVTSGTFVSALKADVTADKTVANTNETINFTTTASGGYTTYQYKYAFTNLDTKEVSETSYSDSKTYSKSFTVAGSYQAKVSVKDYSGKVVTDTVNFTVESKEFKVTSFEVTPVKNVGLYEFANMKVSSTGGSGQYFYKYTYSIYGQEHIIYDYSQASQASYQFANMGTYTINVYVKDGIGATPVKLSQQFVVNQTYVFELNTDKDNAYVGETVKIIPTMYNEASVIKAEHYFYTVTDEAGVTQTVTTNSDKTGSWTPTKAGTYKVRLDVKYVGKTIASNTMDVTVEKKPANLTTIYYKGYSTPYIHYKVSGQSWTAVPGVKMDASSEVSGYTHKYTIDLGTATYVTVCFNNGNGSWDSNNGSNYKFNAGTYTYSGSVITPINPVKPQLSIKSFDITPANGVINENESVKMNLTMTDSNATYMAQFAYRDANGKETVIYDYAYASGCTKQFTQAGTYTLIARVKENPYSTEILTAEKTVTVKALPKFAIKSFTINPADGKVNVMDSVKMNLEMEDSSKSYLVQFVCIDEKGNETVIYDYAYANACTKQFTQVGTYTLMVRVKENPYSTNILTASKTVTVLPKKLSIKSFDITPADGVINENESVKMNLTMSDSNATYMAQFAYRDANGKETVIYDYAYASGCTKQFTQAGTYTLIARVKENPYSTEILTAEKTITVKALPKFAIKSFAINPADGKVNVMDSVKMNLEMEDSSKSYLVQFVCIDEKGNETVIYDYAYANACTKQFTQAGTYTLMVRVKENPYSTNILTASKTVTVTEPVKNTTTIYYKGYSTPYIHYQVAGQSWTKAPGVQMTATSEVNGYTHKAVIDLDAATSVTVCFNNGNNTWDSNNGKNYKFNAGTYTFSNGKIEEYDPNALKIASFDITPANGIINVNESVKMTVTMTNPNATYMTQFAYVDGSGKETVIYDYAYANGCTKQFTQAGTYKLIVRVKENPYSTDIITVEKTVTVVDPSANVVTIYYKGYSTPYIHYQVAGQSWTNAPGVQMTATTEKAGYTHKAVIDLGTASNVTVCFNNGNGTWDSNNGANYKFEAGTYTFSNGVITKI